MTLNENIKKIIIQECKDLISELSEITAEELEEPENLNDAWEVIKQQNQNSKFNLIVKYIIDNINDFIENSEDDFIYINKIAKTSLNATSIPFYNEVSATCLLYISQDAENDDIDFSILAKIILIDFKSILALEQEDIAIFQKKDINELCLEDKETYSKILLANIGLSVKNDIAVTQKIFLDTRQLTCNKNYLQYKDSIDILNKYNNTSDILWKFLLLYQILENFSYRRSIAKSLRDTSSLNIKHLSNVYTSSKGEGIFIRDSIKKFLLNITNSTYFSHEEENGNIICLKLMDENNSSKKIKLDSIDTNIKNVAEFLNIELKKIDSHKEISSQEVGGIIYTIRNCIVHNKETEWIHINNSLLQEKPDLKKFFEKFILPTMEFIIKELMFKENIIIDYPNDKPNYLLIWGEAPTHQGDNYQETSFTMLENNETSLFNRFKLKFLECKNLISSC